MEPLAALSPQVTSKVIGPVRSDALLGSWNVPETPDGVATFVADAPPGAIPCVSRSPGLRATGRLPSWEVVGAWFRLLECKVVNQAGITGPEQRS